MHPSDFCLDSLFGIHVGVLPEEPRPLEAVLKPRAGRGRATTREAAPRHAIPAGLDYQEGIYGQRADRYRNRCLGRERADGARRLDETGK